MAYCCITFRLEVRRTVSAPRTWPGATLRWPAEQAGRLRRPHRLQELWMVNMQTKWGIHKWVFVIPTRGKAAGTAVPLIRNQRVLSRGCGAGRHIKRSLAEQRRRLRKPLVISRGESKQQGGIGFNLDRRRKRSRRRRQELKLRNAVGDGHRCWCRRTDTGSMKIRLQSRWQSRVDWSSQPGKTGTQSGAVWQVRKKQKYKSAW